MQVLIQVVSYVTGGNTALRVDRFHTSREDNRQVTKRCFQLFNTLNLKKELQEN